LFGLRKQSLAKDRWELLIVDNNSTNDFATAIDLSWHSRARIINEAKQGLTYARVKGFSAASGQVIVMVDDDNVLNEGYLQTTLAIFNQYPLLGAAGGKSLPVFEHPPPQWLELFYSCLALRDLGDAIVLDGWQDKYPACAPIGAGMAVRKKALATYLAKITSASQVITDRDGKSLGSGGDNDIVLEILKSGWQTGYFPALKLVHLIPEERVSAGYLARLNRDSSRSWVRLLESHHINPWRKIPEWSVPFRKIKAWLTYKAWINDANYIKWHGACGIYEGLAE